MRHARPIALLSALLLAGTLPTAAEAQLRRRCRSCERDRDRVHVVVRDGDRWYGGGRQLSLMVGVLDSDFANDENLPMAALRADWRLSRWVRSEVDATYAVGELEFGTPTGDVNTSLFTATVGVQGELPLPFVRPYAGVAVGLFGRFDEKGTAGAERFVRTTTAFPVGLRLRFSPRLALRGEVRFRFDAHPDGATAANVEQTAGLSVTF
jgi:hypothetical protein